MEGLDETSRLHDYPRKQVLLATPCFLEVYSHCSDHSAFPFRGVNTSLKRSDSKESEMTDLEKRDQILDGFWRVQEAFKASEF